MVTVFFLIDIKTSRLLHFDAYEYLEQIYEDHLPNLFQTKLHRRFYTPTRPLHIFSPNGGPRPPLRFIKGGPAISKGGPKITFINIFIFYKL